MLAATPSQAALAVEQVRTSNVLIDAARLESVLDALIDAEGFTRTVARVQRAPQSQAARRQVDGWVS